MITIDPQVVGQSLVYVTLVLVVVFFAGVLLTGGLDRDEKKRIAVIFVLFLFATVFWSAFEQAPTSLNLFAADFTDRVVGGWQIPAVWFQSVNSAFIILLAPAFAALWVTLGKRNINIASPSKFAVGLAMAGIAFVIMYFAAKRVVGGGPGMLRVAVVAGGQLLLPDGRASSR